jgi:hypothetical protein
MKPGRTRGASAARLHGVELSRLLCLVADDMTGGIIITTAKMRWLYRPYDGGADVIDVSTRATETNFAACTQTSCPLTLRNCNNPGDVAWAAGLSRGQSQASFP